MTFTWLPVTTTRSTSCISRVVASRVTGLGSSCTRSAGRPIFSSSRRMPSTAGCVAAQAEGGGAMMTALPPLSAIIALLTGVADGLVEGVSAPTTPTGLAYLTIPLSGTCSMMPVDFTLSRSRRVPNVFLWFLTTLLSTSPIPVTSTAISASRRARAGS